MREFGDRSVCHQQCWRGVTTQKKENVVFIYWSHWAPTQWEPKKLNIDFLETLLPFVPADNVVL
jgi:hypothetical protein